MSHHVYYRSLSIYLNSLDIFTLFRREGAYNNISNVVLCTQIIKTIKYFDRCNQKLVGSRGPFCICAISFFLANSFSRFLVLSAANIPLRWLQKCESKSILTKTHQKSRTNKKKWMEHEHTETIINDFLSVRLCFP